MTSMWRAHVHVSSSSIPTVHACACTGFLRKPNGGQLYSFCAIASTGILGGDPLRNKFRPPGQPGVPRKNHFGPHPVEGGQPRGSDPSTTPDEIPTSAASLLEADYGPPGVPYLLSSITLGVEGEQLQGSDNKSKVPRTPVMTPDEFLFFAGDLPGSGLESRDQPWGSDGSQVHRAPSTTPKSCRSTLTPAAIATGSEGIGGAVGPQSPVKNLPEQILRRRLCQNVVIFPN